MAAREEHQPTMSPLKTHNYKWLACHFEKLASMVLSHFYGKPQCEQSCRWSSKISFAAPHIPPGIICLLLFMVQDTEYM